MTDRQAPPDLWRKATRASVLEASTPLSPRIELTAITASGIPRYSAMTSNLTKNLKQPALDFLSFVNASPTRNASHLPTSKHPAVI